MIRAIQIFCSICLVFSGGFFVSSCNKALHNEGRTAFRHEQIEVKNTFSEKDVWQTEHLAIKYRLEDGGSSFVIAGTMEIKGRITLSFPIVDFLNIYVNLLDQNGVVTSRHDISPSVSRYNTVPDQIPFHKRVKKDKNTTSIAFSYWGSFRERGILGFRDAVAWEIFYNPFEKRE